MIKFNFKRFKAGLQVAGLITGATMLFAIGLAFVLWVNTYVHRKDVVWDNQYVAVALTLKSPQRGNIYVGCADDSIKLTVRKDSILFDGAHTKARYKTLLIDTTNSLFYGIRKDGTLVVLTRMKRHYMPPGKQYELLHVDEKEALLLLNAFEPCPNRKPKLNEVLPIGD